MPREPIRQLGKRRRRAWIALTTALLFCLLAAIFVFPVRYIHDLKVEEAQPVRAGEPDGSTKPAALTTPARLTVMFSTSRDIDELRARNDYGIIWAVLSACGKPSLQTEEVFTQRIDYVPDYGRVRRLGMTSGTDGRRFRYRVVFDGQLAESEEFDTRRVTLGRAPGGLCLSLHGGGMWPGVVWSRQVPVAVDDLRK